MKRQTHYTTLSVDRCASCEEIKSAFRILAQRFHPDVTKDRDGERKFKDVAEAYRTLKRPESRLAYDHLIHNICRGKAGLGKAELPDPGVFQPGFAWWHFLPWFWLLRDDDAE